MALDQRRQRLDAQAVGFDRHADDARAAGAEGFERAEKAGLLDQDGVASADEDLGGQVDALLATAGDAHDRLVDVEAALLEELRR